MATIKSTDFAHEQAAKMLGLITHQFPALVHQLNNHGQQMSDPNHWSGPLADKFRGEVWPKAKSDLDRITHSLEDLQKQVQTILTNITNAGS